MLSYTFHFSSCIIGPSIEFVYFRKFINKEEEYKNIPFNACLIFTLKQLGLWLVYSAIHILGNIFIPLEYFMSDDYIQISFIYKLFSLYILGILLRSRYYSCWTLNRASMSFCGITYNNTKIEKDSKIIGDFFEKAPNFEISTVELEPNVKKKLTVIYLIKLLINNNLLIIKYRNGI